MGMTGVALRYQNVYGPGQCLSTPYTGILSIFSTQILNSQGINVFEDGLESRDFVFIDDIARANCLALTGDDSLMGVINIGCGIGTTVLAYVLVVDPDADMHEDVDRFLAALPDPAGIAASVEGYALDRWLDCGLSDALDGVA